MYLYTHSAVLEALTTGISFRRAFSDAEYFFRSNTARSFSDDSKMNTRADHSAGESSCVERLPDLRYCWISSTREQSLSSFRQWNRLMLFSGGRSLLIFFLMYLTVSWMVCEPCSTCVSRPWRRDWLACNESPRRNRRNKSRCPFGLPKALSTALS